MILCHVIARLNFYMRIVHASLLDFKSKLSQSRALDDAAAEASGRTDDFGDVAEAMDREVANTLLNKIDNIKKRKELKSAKMKLGRIFAQYKFLQFLTVQLNFAKIDIENTESDPRNRNKNQLKLKQTLAAAAGCAHIKNIFKGLKPITEIDPENDLSLCMVPGLFGVEQRIRSRQTQRNKSAAKYRTASAASPKRRRSRSPPAQMMLSGEIVNGCFMPGGRFAELLNVLCSALRLVVKYYNKKVQSDFSFQQVILKKMVPCWHELMYA